MTNEDQAATNRARAEMEEIERAAMRDQPGWKAYFANLSEQAREIAVSTLTDRRTFDRWRVLKMIAATRDK